MSPEAKKNITATFEANINHEVLFADANGHCFTRNAEGLEEVRRADYVGKKTKDVPADGSGAEGDEVVKGGKSGKKK